MTQQLTAIISRYPSAEAFATMREEACAEEIHSMSIPVARIALQDPKDRLPPAHPTITREMILDDVHRTTSEALDVLEFDPSSGLRPPVELVRALAKAGKFASIGDVFNRSSDIAQIWHDNTAYSPLALATQYNGEGMLPIPQVRADGTVPQAHEADRKFGGFLEVPEDDPARAAWRYHPDTIELRKRGAHLQNIIIDHFSDTQRYPNGSRVRIAAIAGGAAWPDMQAAVKLGQVRPDLTIGVDVFDWDKAATHLGIYDAVNILQGDSEDQVAAQTDEARQITTIEKHNVKVRFINADITDQKKLLSHANENGSEGYDIAEAVGLVEYFQQDHAPFVVANMDALLKERVGLGVVANMTEYHDYPQILGVIGWRLLRPRSISDISQLVDDGIKMGDGNRIPDKKLDLLDEKSYLYASWRK